MSCPVHAAERAARDLVRLPLPGVPIEVARAGGAGVALATSPEHIALRRMRSSVSYDVQAAEPDIVRGIGASLAFGLRARTHP
ncbi:hypothetical protein [Nonomuraea sp. SYSU D8015]|uniref:hypothetical protein n=1 Tax=Nonomuraea sp. SYSU D8015 TaxID=2593644 RepID=UPI001660898B|nr:hypothetical protein [Nonomuraea sp. SYSU D8015]